MYRLRTKEVLTSIALLAIVHVTAAQQCLSDADIESTITGTLNGPEDGSCCQQHICGLPCPEPVSSPGKGYGIAVGVSIAVSFVAGLMAYMYIKGKSENYFVAGRSLPIWVVSVTLAASSIDSNALLGNADLTFKFQFWDGAVLPIGLGISLLLNGIFLAHHINNDNALTLPDVLAKRYGKTVEVLVSLCTIVSFTCLLAGNLVGMGSIVGYTWGFQQNAAIWLSAAILWAYTVSGGLFSVAVTDVIQGFSGFTGCLVCALYLIANDTPSAPPPSIGFPSYVYPDDETCAMYGGIPCTYVSGACCYNNATGITDNGAYPFGDKRIFSNQMTSPSALSPFPNGIFWNWCTIFILGIGNLAALDFQARCMAAKSPSVARISCFIAAAVTFLVGIPFAYLGAITRVHYGPDSVHAEFTADTCSEILGLPTCAEWVPDKLAFLKLLTHQAPAFLGAWCMLGIVSASMSTASGAILAMGTVFSHNIMRQLDTIWPSLVTADTLLLAARVSTIPFALAATLIAAYYGETGYLLIVAFDVVLATVVAPLLGCFYAKNPSPRAAFLSVITGALLRVMLEFLLPKDGFLILPFDLPEFENYGSAASAGLPVYFDAPAENLWDPATEPCNQKLYEDYTGVDSMSAFLVSVIVYVTVQVLEHKMQRPLFNFPGSVPYDKNEEIERKAIERKANDETVEFQTSEEHAVQKNGAEDPSFTTDREDRGDEEEVET